MTRKCHNNTPQTNPGHHKEETYRQIQYSKDTIKVKQPVLFSSELHTENILITKVTKQGSITKPQQ